MCFDTTWRNACTKKGQFHEVHVMSCWGHSTCPVLSGCPVSSLGSGCGSTSTLCPRVSREKVHCCRELFNLGGLEARHVLRAASAVTAELPQKFTQGGKKRFSHRGAGGLHGSLGPSEPRAQVPPEKQTSRCGDPEPSRGMSLAYGQRSLAVLCLLGLLSAIMSVPSVLLIAQLRSQQAAVNASPSSAASVVPAPVRAVLLPVSTVLSALSLTLHLSSAAACLLHGHFSAEACGGDPDPHRADWFLLDSRAVRHLAVGLFCLGVSVYLAAMSIYMLLIFEVETGIASACVLSTGILILLVVVIHSLAKASHSSKHYHGDHLDTLYQNDHGRSGIPVSRPCELKIGVDKPRMHRSLSHLQHPSAYPYCNNPRQQEQQQQYSPAGASLGHESDKDGYSSGGSGPRMHRTLSAEFGLLRAQAKPWNGVNNEMRSVLARKSGISAKDSTLV